jgi:SAM-dependent methyltransferase
LEHFNYFDGNEIEKAVAVSSTDFFSKDVLHRITLPVEVLDLGPGSKSIFECFDLTNIKVTAIDFSKVAHSLAKLNKSQIDYVHSDLTIENVVKENHYDLIFDSHCLHCIEDIDQRKKAFKNIYLGLKQNGIFAAEMMIQPNHNQIKMPFKYIPKAELLEQELIDSGLKIIKFVILHDYVFYNENEVCDIVRLLAIK